MATGPTLSQAWSRARTATFTERRRRAAVSARGRSSSFPWSSKVSLRAIQAEGCLAFDRHAGRRTPWAFRAVGQRIHRPLRACATAGARSAIAETMHRKLRGPNDGRGIATSPIADASALRVRTLARINSLAGAWIPMDAIHAQSLSATCRPLPMGITRDARRRSFASRRMTSVEDRRGCFIVAKKRKVRARHRPSSLRAH